jgi:hypothetical protein
LLIIPLGEGVNLAIIAAHGIYPLKVFTQSLLIFQRLMTILDFVGIAFCHSLVSIGW